jgi:hypothetical protein
MQMVQVLVNLEVTNVATSMEQAGTYTYCSLAGHFRCRKWCFGAPQKKIDQPMSFLFSRRGSRPEGVVSQFLSGVGCSSTFTHSMNQHASSLGTNA